MRLFVKKGAHGETHVVPCSDSAVSVETLKAAIVSRLCSGSNCEKYRLTFSGNEAVLDEKDAVKDVLQDGDCLSLTTSCKQLHALYTNYSCHYTTFIFCSSSSYQ